MTTKKIKKKTKRIETRKQFIKQNFYFFSKLQIEIKNCKKINQIIKNEKIENDELFDDENDIFEKKITFKSIFTKNHKRINESKLIKSNKKN